MKKLHTMVLMTAALSLLGTVSVRATILADNIAGQLQSDLTAQRQPLFSGLSRDDTDSDTIYIRWTVLAYENQDTENYYNGLSLADDTDGNGFKLGIGNNWDAFAYTTFGGGDLELNSANPNPTNGTSQLVVTNDVTTFVMRIDYNAGADDDVTIYLDPFLGTTELGQDTNLITTLSEDMSFFEILSEGSGGALVGWYYTNAIVSDDALDIFSADADDDGDGLPNTWELAYGLDPNDDGSIDINNGAIGDPDVDGSVNSNEYAKSTFPDDSDSDNDDLNDGDEDTEGTDPLDPDTDDDSLSDGDEVNTYSTDPLVKDSDIDGVNDGTEVACGSDPNSAGSLPANDNPNVIGADFFDYTDGFVFGQNGGEFWDMDNSVSNDAYVGHTCTKDAWYDFGSSAFLENQQLITSSDRQGLRNFNGSGSGGTSVGLFSSAIGSGSTPSNLYVKVDVTVNNDSYAGLSLYNEGSERLFFGATGSTGNWGIDGADIAPQAPVESLVGPAPGVTYTLVAKVNIAGEFCEFWIDPILAAPEGLADLGPTTLAIEAPFNITYTGLRLQSGNAGDVRWDNLVVAYTWEALQYAGEDTDVDGLRDAWENVWTNDLTVLSSGSDFDNDNLDDDEEQELSTNPLLSDTDGDGLTDDDEVNIYSTNPADADSDDDGLDDGYEVVANPYITNPNSADTDVDGYDDLIETNAGTDPTDPLDNSSTTSSIAIDGVLENSVYGAPVSSQTIETGFGDNFSELNAAYVHVVSNKMYMLLTGNIEANFNKIEIFFDSNDLVTTNVLTTTDGDGGAKMNGMTFDTGFEPDIHCYFRRSATEAYFDIIDLAALTNSTYGSLFDSEGSAITGTGAANSFPMEIAYNGSNVDGVGGTTGEAALPDAATNSIFGLEICIDLVDLGAPNGIVTCAVMINGSNRDYLSNQMLDGLPVGTGNLGGDMTGNGVGDLTGIDFNLAPGDQFFSFAASYIPDAPVISSIAVISGGTQVELGLSNLTRGVYYVIEDTPDLESAFTEVPGSGLNATDDTDIVTVPASGSEQFFKAAIP